MERLRGTRLFKNGVSEKLLFALLVCLYIVPLWAFRYVPTADGPSHLANAVIIKDYGDADAATLREYYVISRRPSPNLLYHLSLIALLHVFPPSAAEKVILSLYVVLFAGSFRYLFGAFGRKVGPAALLVFPFIYSFSFNLGFFGWTISLALAALGVGYYWRRRDALTVRAVVALNVLGLLTYFAHLLGWFIFVGTVAGLALSGGVWRAIKSRRARAGAAAVLRAFWARAAVVAYIAPAAAAGVAYVLKYPSDYPVTRTPFWGLAAGLFRLEWLISFNAWQRATAYATAAFFGVLVLSVLAYKIYVTLLCRSFRAPGGWAPTDAVWGVALAYVVLYFCCPWGGPAGGSYVNPRLALLPFLAAAAWLSTVRIPAVRRALFAVAPALAALSLGALALGWAGANRELEEYNSGVPYVTGRPTVLPIHNLNITGTNNKADYLYNAASYYVIENYGVNLLNYEADFDYFPVNWRHGPPVGEPLAETRGTPIYDAEAVYRSAEYVVCWKVNPFCVGMRPIVSRYDLIYSTTHLMVFKRRSS